jgi:DNA-binding transcriptional ArsR family regulator
VSQLVRTTPRSGLHGEVDLATLGALIADRTRATFLLSLLGGGLTPASALAARAGVSASLASNHLRKLSDGGLIVAERRGRQRLYRLASSTIADALEALISVAPPGQEQSLRGVRARDSLRRGRLCYDHLAGRAGVAIVEGLLSRAWLVETDGGDYVVTDAGARGLGSIGVDVRALSARARPLTRACMDWSEQRPHLAGSVGASLTAEFQRRGWLQSPEASRAARVTDEGRRALHAWLGLDPRVFELPVDAARAA